VEYLFGNLMPARDLYDALQVGRSVIFMCITSDTDFFRCCRYHGFRRLKSGPEE
jgi:hypothetical protein